MTFSWKTHLIFFWEKPKVCRFWDFLLSQSPSAAIFPRLYFSGSRNYWRFCFKRPIYLFKEKSFLKVLQNFFISSTFCNIFATFSDFKNADFFGNPICLLRKKSNFEYFENSTFRRFLQQICNFQWFWIIWDIFLEKPVLFIKKRESGTLWALLLSQSLFRQNFLRLTSSGFKKF